ncbi:hypothetical protein B0H10DRAFT_2069241 [Mycena sp. CBHHK59/15]|nr:hypothetical protein B0H10DRAFT_2069241 [Mycena sp. CBHHK59/15]
MPSRKFTSEEDETLISYLAEPVRFYEDRTSIHTYKALGPDAVPEYKWSRGRKPESWQRRYSNIPDADRRIFAEGKHQYEMDKYGLHYMHCFAILLLILGSSKAQSHSKGMDAKKENRKTKFGGDEKPESKAAQKEGSNKRSRMLFEDTSQARVATPTYSRKSFRKDVGKIADRYGVHHDRILNIVGETGSLLKAEEVARLLSTSSDKTQSRIMAKLAAQEDEESDADKDREDESSEEDEVESASGKKVARAPTDEYHPGQVSKPKSEKQARFVVFDSDSDDYASPLKRRRCAYAVKSEPDEPNANDMQLGRRSDPLSGTKWPTFTVEVVIPVHRFYARPRPSK